MGINSNCPAVFQGSIIAEKNWLGYVLGFFRFERISSMLLASQKQVEKTHHFKAL